MNSSQLFKLPFKATKPLDDLAKALTDYVDESSHTTHPSAIEQDAVTFSQKRKALFDDPATLTKIAPALLTDLLAYYGQVSYALTKFPQDANVSFPWFPVFSTPTSSTLAVGGFPAAVAISLQDLQYEKACVLYNIAAYYTALALSTPAADEAGYKQRIQHFQHAAGTFVCLRKEVKQINTDPPAQNPASPDLSEAAIDAFESACLAQAQETFWHKSVTDKLKNGTIAKLALQTSMHYERAASRAAASKGANGVWPLFSFPAGLLNHFEVKKRHFEAVAQYRRAVDDLSASRYGHELARLAIAEEALAAASTRFTKGVADAVINESKAFLRVVQDNKKRATKDNDLIYLEQIPSPANLPAITPAAMAQSIPPKEVSSPLEFLHSGPGGHGVPLFSALKSFSIVAASELYRDRKEQHVDEHVGQPKKAVEERVSGMLKEAGLPASLHAAAQPVGLPSSTIQQSAVVRSRGGPSRIRDMLHDTRRLAQSNQKTLNEALNLMSAEEDEDNAARSKFGTERWQRLPSEEAGQALRARAIQLQQILDAARKSDNIVREKFGKHESALHLLSLGENELEAKIPSANKASVVASDPVVRTLRRELEALDDLRAKVTRCYDDCRRAMQADDATPAIEREADSRTRQGKGTADVADFEDVIARELAKYDKYEEQLEGFSRQVDDSLEKVRTANEAFVKSRKEGTETIARERTLLELDAAFDMFNEIQGNLEEGAKFYSDLARLLSELRDACKQWSHARSVEAKSTIDELTSKTRELKLAAQQPGVWDPQRDGGIRFG